MTKAMPDLSKTFSVGWFTLTPAQMLELPEQDRVNSITLFGGNAPVCFYTAQEAQGFLDCIVSVNGETKIRDLTPLGSSGLFICTLVVTGDGKRWVKYSTPHHLIPTRPTDTLLPT
jgi:hypothetical protein